ncbi:U11/U12 small nuclear ribonucleoprotein [Choanephora cucurbitarum]|uniref:U11/U12 small nuclear ribonucleoprotein n=1 Tax=Choanephora cucurbitarum TaxID=101091 RepID=A0A1C7NAZ9_9FUNG|nr:U11/U12 small nuclear ribonucleoprotein [Choanephora cucurbitarum]
MTENDDQALLKKIQAEINELLKDELLQDLSSNPDKEELNALIAVEKGQAYHITVQRDPLPPIYIVVRQSSTVKDIKHLIRLEVERMDKQGTKKISWKYIWHAYCLMFEHQRLLDDKVVVSQLGMKQHSVLRFSRLAHQKGQHRKARHY